ncbi:U3 snoRNP protein [Gnomoniopsis smithogilvyi]|uniref:U3 small nucleolar RNA-associated protein 22 n=1 Tax=Gnomoniopsis smithogilvyi TaxID=1191159 RepID=A0A9W8YLY9_9PEZI|nr:U3 snoRNP protein [Gnomoniopsis smithogilvyi]
MDSNPAKRRKLEHQPPCQDESSTGVVDALDAAATAGTSRPSAFVLQTQELLREVRINYEKTFAGADDLLRQIKSTIEAIHPQSPTPINQATSALEKKHGLVVPFPDPKPPKDSPYKVSFSKPSQINIVGSYVSRTMVKSQSHRVIDMIIEMPKDLFQDKDYMNLRYFYKRAYYLAVLSAALQSEYSSGGTLVYDYMNESRLLPVLVFSPQPASRDVDANAKKPHRAYQIRIIPCAPEGLFPANKLSPTSCCIRSGTEDQSAAVTQIPTLFYNSTLKAESCYIPYLKVIRQAEKTCPAFREACMLGRVWLQQRGLAASISKGGFGHFEWAFLTALLLQGGGRKGMAALSPSLSSTQIFKALIQYLAAADLTKKPLIFGSHKYGVQAAKETGPVIFDTLRQLNVAYKMSTWSASLLQQHAKWTHNCLADQEADQFNPTFIIKADSPQQCFDLLVRVDQVAGAHMQEHRGPSWEYCDKVARILYRALGDRVKLIHLEPLSNLDTATEDLKSLPHTDHSAILVGIIFDAANMARQVDHGPTVEEKEAAKAFRQFWGDKSELRRFKDGSILESLIWTQTSPLALCEEITRYILKQHLRLDDEHLQFHGKGFSAVVPIKSSDSSSFQACRRAFSVFEQDLRDLTDLPLQIRSVTATAPELRYASVRPPTFDLVKRPGQAMDTAIYFEASGKWPENLAAIQRTKIAFLLKIGESLSASKPSTVCQVGLEEAEAETENLAFLDVTYEEGAIFRLRIHSDLEQSLLERRTKDKTMDQRVRTEGAQLLAYFKRLYTILPLHTQTIATYCGRFPALSPTIRLVKRWFDSHKLSYHFLEEMLELLALRVFLEPYPWQAPSSATTGFLRTLQFLARWDWRVEPLILDTSEELVGSERSAIETRLEAWRKIDPSMSHTTLFVATTHDTSGTAYSIHRGRPYPSKVVATRMTTLARSACKWVKDNGVTLEPKTLFQPSLKNYDILIHLKSGTLKAVSQGNATGKQSHFKNLDGRTGKTPEPVVQRGPRMLLQQFENLLSGPLLLFHGAPDDMTIGGIWNPQIQRRTFRVNLPCSFRPVDQDLDNESEEVVEVNREGIIAELARIGGDCIERIEVTKPV